MPAKNVIQGVGRAFDFMISKTFSGWDVPDLSRSTECVKEAVEALVDVPTLAPDQASNPDRLDYNLGAVRRVFPHRCALCKNYLPSPIVIVADAVFMLSLNFKSLPDEILILLLILYIL